MSLQTTNASSKGDNQLRHSYRRGRSFSRKNRYRDIAVNPNGLTFYVITDAQGSTASVDGGATDALENMGSVFEFVAD